MSVQIVVESAKEPFFRLLYNKHLAVPKGDNSRIHFGPSVHPERHLRNQRASLVSQNATHKCPHG